MNIILCYQGFVLTEFVLKGFKCIAKFYFFYTPKL